MGFEGYTMRELQDMISADIPVTPEERLEALNTAIDMTENFLADYTEQEGKGLTLIRELQSSSIELRRTLLKKRELGCLVPTG